MYNYMYKKTKRNRKTEAIHGILKSHPGFHEIRTKRAGAEIRSASVNDRITRPSQNVEVNR